MSITKDIVVAEGEFLSENGSDAQFLIISVDDVNALANESATDLGLLEDEACVYDVTSFRGKIVCVVFDPIFSGFVLK